MLGTCVVGAQPNFMKIVPLMNAFKAKPSIEPMLGHTGQQHDERISDLFFRQLEISEPHINPACGGGSHVQQTGTVMPAFDPVVLEQLSDAVLVVDGVNSIIRCGMVAVKLVVKLVHIEAGLRSNDHSTPEEINCILTDAISEILFCAKKSGIANLRREGLTFGKIHLLGNVMIDTLAKNRAKTDGTTPPLWDGHAAERIARIIVSGI